MTLAHALYLKRKRLRLQQEVRAFDALVASPFDLGSAAAGSALPNTFALPHNGRFAVSASAGVQQGDLLIAFGARIVSTRSLAADELYRLHYFERDRLVELSSDPGCPACDVTLYLLDERFKPFPIATGSVT